MDDVIAGTDVSIDDKIKDFGSLLDQIENLTEKKKQLWKEIYENAITDRQNAFVMFLKLSRIAQDKSSEHALHGRNIAVYLERMSKANDQLIKLAELIAAADHSTQELSPDEIFDKIGK